MDFNSIFPDGGSVTMGADMTPFDANFQGFITPLTYVAVVTGGATHFLAMMGVGT